uniref:CUB domain-containing protein n=1 Tax=Knipowitschia caucasica TaxID=637954 RepID=A0AAV2L6J8_KNICA
MLSAVALHTSVRLHISLCPLVYYGKPYHHLHMNHTPEGLFICMDGFLSRPITGDCIQMPSVTSDPVVLVSAAAPGLQSEQLGRHFPELQQNGTLCGVEVQLRFSPSNTSVFRMFSFGDVSVLHLEPLGPNVTVSFYVKGQLWSSWIIGAVSNHSFFLPAACRLGDSVIRPNSSINKDSCTDTKCDALGRIHVSSCGGQQTCIGHNCSLDLLCSVLGPLVVDFRGNMRMIPNRCTFVLLETTYCSIRAVFRDRRRQDLVFIESLSFRIQNDTFSCSRERSLLDSSYIHGLCSDSWNITGNILHTQGCDAQYQEAPDPFINLAVVTQRCHFFLKDVGSPCHLEVNPRPFVRSCLELFSFYPDTDGIDHEFCGISPEGAPYCQCRAIYAAPFRQSGTYNLPVDCGKNSSSLSLVTCLLEDTPFSPLDLHLLDPTCKGQMDPVTHMLRFSFNHSHKETNCGGLVLNGPVFDPALIRQVSPQTDIPVGTRVWVALTLKQVDHLIKSSWATPSSATPFGVTPPRPTPPRAKPSRATPPMATSPRATPSWVTLTWALPSSAPPSSAPPSSTTASLQDYVPRRKLIVERCASAGAADVVVERNNGESRSIFSFKMFCFEGFPPGIRLHTVTEKFVVLKQMKKKNE